MLSTRGAHPLSEIDVNAFEKFWLAHSTSMIAQLDYVYGYEIGNEINTSGFNADYPVLFSVMNLDFDKCSTKECKGAARGFVRFIQLLRAVRRSPLLKGRLLLASGFADVSDDWMKRTGSSFTAAEHAIQYVAKLGIMDVVDAISIHRYPGIGSAEKISWREQDIV